MRADVPSSTAALVALGSLCILRDETALWDPTVEPLLTGFLSHPAVPWTFRALASACRWKIFRSLLRRAMDVFVPGLFAHYVARKIFIEARVRAEILQGAKQLVVIAGGFDTLAVRMAKEFPSLSVVEIDHPATQAAKRAALDEPLPLSRNLTLLPADLEKISLATALEKARVSRNLQTIFVLEGVLMYLKPESVTSLFAALASHCEAKGVPAICLFTCMEPQENGRIAFRGGQGAIVDTWLGSQRERFKWGLRPDGAARFFADVGWTVEDLAHAKGLAQTANFGEHRHLRLAQGEYVVVARRKHGPTDLPPA